MPKQYLNLFKINVTLKKLKHLIINMSEPARSAVYKEVRKLKINTTTQEKKFSSNSIKTARYNM
jgi:hypothetical protein